MGAYSKEELIRQWIEIYETYFGYSDCYFDEELIPDWYSSKEHFGILVMENVTVEEAVDACEQTFRVIWNHSDYIGGNLPELINAREPNSDYCIIFEKAYEARECRDTDEDEIDEKGITLLERLLLDIYNYHFKQFHIDQNSTTGCSGSLISSRDEDENGKMMTVSAVGKGNEEIHIGFFYKDTRHSRAKIRPYLYYCEA